MSWEKEAAATAKSICKGPCPVCGGTKYNWGKISARDLRSNLSEVTSWASGFPAGSLKARRCDGCGNLQLFDESGD